MRRLIVLIGLLTIGSSSICAQECCPRWELFGGYSYLNSSATGDLITSTQFNGRYGLQGFGVNLAGNFSRRLGIAADFSFNRRASNLGGLDVGGIHIGDARTTLRSYSFLFGPRFSTRDGGIKFFAEGLAGFARRDANLRGSLGTGGAGASDAFHLSSNSFAFALGGGVDIEASKHISIRLLQFDYIPAKVAGNSSSEGAWSHNYRLQGGLALRWGLVK